MLILHLSDIHFHKDQVGTAMDPYRHLRAELLKDAAAECKKRGEVPAAIIISGDIAFQADDAEYKFALTWLEELATACGTDMKPIFVVPGNHDANRKTAAQPVIQTLHDAIKNAAPIALDYTLSGFLRDKDAGRLLYEPLSSYNKFAFQFFCDIFPPERTIAVRELVLNDGSILKLQGLNSAFVSSAADKKEDLFVDPACTQITKEPGVENLIVCHHPYSWLRGGSRVEDHLNAVATIQMFGHEHTHRVALNRDYVRLSAGAMHPDRRETEFEPGYNLITLSVNGVDTDRNLEITVYARVWQDRPPEFRYKTDKGQDFFKHSIKLDPWKRAPQEPALPEILVPAERDNDSTATGSDPMDSLRDISIRFFKLSLSQKAAIAGKLDLLKAEDENEPDFERFRRAFIRAREQGIVDKLDAEVKTAMEKK